MLGGGITMDQGSLPLFGAASKDALVLRPELAQGLDVARQNAQAVSRGL